MNRERCEQWEAAFAKQERGETISNEEHMALVPRGLFEGMSEVEAYDEAEKVMRYHLHLHGFDLTPIAPRGPAIGGNWFTIGPTFGEHRADEALQNFIEASTRDPDYWKALTVIAAPVPPEAPATPRYPGRLGRRLS